MYCNASGKYTHSEIQVITTFAASALIALCLSFANLVFTASDAASNYADRWIYLGVRSVCAVRFTPEVQEFWIPIIEKVILSVSDQQLLTGIAVLIAGFWTHCSISVYHFSLVNDLAFFSSLVHMITLDVLQSYLRAKKTVRNWRVVLMSCTALSLIASCVMEGHKYWFDSWSYDAQCLFDDLIGNIGGGPAYWMKINIFLIGFYYIPNVLLLYGPPSRFLKVWFLEKPVDALSQALRSSKSRWSHSRFALARLISILYGLQLVAIITLRWTYLILITLLTSRYANFTHNLFWFGYSMWGIVIDRRIPPSEMDGSENVMSFGQIVPILLLSSTLFVFREAYDGMFSPSMTTCAALIYLRFRPNVNTVTQFPDSCHSGWRIPH